MMINEIYDYKKNELPCEGKSASLPFILEEKLLNTLCTCNERTREQGRKGRESSRLNRLIDEACMNRTIYREKRERTSEEEKSDDKRSDHPQQ
jgi:hypothetical protein